MQKDWTARNVLEISGAYWAACALQAGVLLDVFTALDPAPKLEKALAAELGCEPRAFSMLVTALISLGFMARKGEPGDGELSVSDSALRLLSRNSPDYLGFIIKHHANIAPAWTKLATAVRTGSSTADRSTLHTPDTKEREDFLMGMFNIARLQADRIADALDLRGRKRLLDVGGGPGTYAIYFCLKNADLKATIFDLPTSEPFARKTIQRFGLERRVEFVGGDFLEDPLPEGHDVAWLSQILHGENPDDAARLVARAGSALEPGGLVCVQDFMLEDDGNGPEHAALFSLNMLVQTAGGQAYSRKEIRLMLENAGAAEIRELEVSLPQSCRVLTGALPR